MRRLLRLLACGVAVVLTASFPVVAQRPPRAVVPDNVRGLWVPRTALVSPASIASVIRVAERGGFNTLLVQVRGRGEAFYRSAIEPRATDLDRQPDAFDPLATAIELGRRAGLKIHAWINVNLVASGATLPRSREHVASLHPEWLMVPRALASPLARVTPRSPAYLGTLSRWTRGAADRVEGLYLSPISVAAQDYTAAVVKEVAERYDVDGVHLDYIRYPNVDFDYSPASLIAFRAAVAASRPVAERQRLDRAAVADPAAWADALAPEWAAFRRDRLTALVRRLQAVVRAARPTALVSAAVVPVPAAARDGRLQDWSAWARAGYLDVICPMIYTTDAAEFTAQAAEIEAELGDLPFWAGIGAWRLPLAQTIEHVRLARRARAGGILLFSYDQYAAAGAQAGDLPALRPVLLESLTGSGSSR
jgi:uncharacterized lipoprotein YddW (UPF0748 family)